MIVTKRKADSIKIEDAHDGSGSRKVLVDKEISNNPNFEAMTYGYLPVGGTFDWHEHLDIEEVMYVIKGCGQVHDEEGFYSYEAGDVFIFPANTQHKIVNDDEIENEMIFIRTRVN